MGDVVADAADRRAAGQTIPDLFARVVPDGPAPAGARHHPHVAVLRPCCARISSTTRCRGRTRRSPAGCSIPIARRCRSRRATSSRRWRCSRSTAPTACATGRRAGGPGTDTAFDAEPDEGRPPARDQAAERVEVRARRRREPQRRRSPQPLDRAMLAQPGARSSTRRRASFEDYDYARALQRDRGVLLALLRRLPRAREGPRATASRGRGARRRPTPRCATALSVLLRLFAPFLPFVTEEVWSWWQRGLDPPRRVADGGGASSSAPETRTTSRARPALDRGTAATLVPFEDPRSSGPQRSSR